MAVLNAHWMPHPMRGASLTSFNSLNYPIRWRHGDPGWIISQGEYKRWTGFLLPESFWLAKLCCLIGQRDWIDGRSWLATIGVKSFTYPCTLFQQIGVPSVMMYKDRAVRNFCYDVQRWGSKKLLPHCFCGDPRVSPWIFCFSHTSQPATFCFAHTSQPATLRMWMLGKAQPFRKEHWPIQIDTCQLVNYMKR